MPLSHKVGVAVSLLLAMAPAYVAGPLTATPRAQSLASADATQKPRSLSAVEFQPLRTFVRDAERRMKSAQGAPKNKARALWLKARSTAELVDNAEWLRRAQQENEALKQGRPPTSSETLNDVAQSRFIVARASYALGDAAGSTQAVREIVARYMEARIDAPDGTPKPVKELLEQELKPIYMRIIQSANTKGGNRGTRR